MRLTDSGGFLLILPPSVLLAIPLSLSPPTRIPSSESHYVLASVFPVELQEDEGERHCVPCNTHPAKFTPSSPLSSFTHILPLSLFYLFSSSYSLLPSCLFLSFYLSFFLCRFFLHSLCYCSRSHKVHITLQQHCVFVCTYICHSVPCSGSLL